MVCIFDFAIMKTWTGSVRVLTEKPLHSDSSMMKTSTQTFEWMVESWLCSNKGGVAMSNGGRAMKGSDGIST